VPEGSYALRILNPSDKQNQQVSVTGGMKMASEKIRDQYGDLEQTIKVEGDISNLCPRRVGAKQTARRRFAVRNKTGQAA
jgi:hypothetical protein